MTVVEAPARTPKPKVDKSTDFRQQGRLAAYLLSPTMAVLLVVIGYPILAAHPPVHVHAGHRTGRGRLRHPGRPVRRASATTPRSSPATPAHRFWNAFYNTTFFTVVCVIIEVIIGVAMALIMNKAFRGRGLIRASILVPWAIPTVVSAMLWALDLRRQRHRQRAHRPAGPVVHRRLPGQARRHHRRHLEDRAVHRPAGAGRPAGYPGRGLRGRQDRRRPRVAGVLAASRCRW